MMITATSNPPITPPTVPPAILPVSTAPPTLGSTIPPTVGKKVMCHDNGLKHPVFSGKIKISIFDTKVQMYSKTNCSSSSFQFRKRAPIGGEP